MTLTPGTAVAHSYTAVTALVTGEASFHAPTDHCYAKLLKQAGVQATWIRLADVGIHGNGHAMMLEKNNLEVADVLYKWIAKTISATTGK